MKTITSIEPQKRRGERANIFLDGRFAFSLQMGVIEQKGLHVGQSLTESHLEELTGVYTYSRCRDYATRLLGYRPRSESEMRVRLGRRFDLDIAEKVISQLKGRQLLDDHAFAQFWRDARESSSPRSKRMLRMELKRKGIDHEHINEALSGIDEEESAHKAAMARGRQLAKEDYETFRKKLSAMLLRRGFSYEIVRQTIERLWLELK